MSKTILRILSIFVVIITLASCTPDAVTGDISGSGGIDEVKTIIFTGDSITDAGRDKEISEGMFLGNGYVSLINEALKERYSENVPLILNSGVSGNTVAQLSSRFKADVDSFSPDWLVLLIGVNDAYSEWSDLGLKCDPENFRKSLQRIFHDYAFAYKKVFILTPFYIEQHDISTKRTEYLDKYVDVLSDVASENENTVFINVQEIFDNKLQEIGNDSFLQLSPDRVHLNEEGSMILRDAMLEAFGVDLSE